MAVELHCLLSAMYHDTFWPRFFHPSCSRAGLSPEVKGQPGDLNGQIICLSFIQPFGLLYFFCAFALSLSLRLFYDYNFSPDLLLSFKKLEWMIW